MSSGGSRLNTFEPSSRHGAPGIAFLDTSFLVDLLFEDARLHAAANMLFRGLTATGAELCMSSRVVDEFLWIARVPLFNRDHGLGAWDLLTSREAADAWLRYSEEIAYLGRLLLSPDAPWEVLSVTAEDAGVAVGAIETHGLQPADAFHYALCRRECESCIITNDRHFRALPELNCVRYDVDV